MNSDENKIETWKETAAFDALNAFEIGVFGCSLISYINIYCQYAKAPETFNYASLRLSEAMLFACFVAALIAIIIYGGRACYEIADKNASGCCSTERLLKKGFPVLCLVLGFIFIGISALQQAKAFGELAGNYMSADRISNPQYRIMGWVFIAITVLTLFIAALIYTKKQSIHSELQKNKSNCLVKKIENLLNYLGLKNISTHRSYNSAALFFVALTGVFFILGTLYLCAYYHAGSMPNHSFKHTNVSWWLMIGFGSLAIGMLLRDMFQAYQNHDATKSTHLTEYQPGKLWGIIPLLTVVGMGLPTIAFILNYNDIDFKQSANLLIAGFTIIAITFLIKLATHFSRDNSPHSDSIQLKH